MGLLLRTDFRLRAKQWQQKLSTKIYSHNCQNNPKGHSRQKTTTTVKNVKVKASWEGLLGVGGRWGKIHISIPVNKRQVLCAAIKKTYCCWSIKWETLWYIWISFCSSLSPPKFVPSPLDSSKFELPLQFLQVHGTFLWGLSAGTVSFWKESPYLGCFWLTDSKSLSEVSIHSVVGFSFSFGWFNPLCKCHLEKQIPHPKQLLQLSLAKYSDQI